MKVYVVVTYYGREGYGEPGEPNQMAFTTKEAARQVTEKYTAYPMKVFELELVDKESEGS